jgi:hypothetical protein
MPDRSRMWDKFRFRALACASLLLAFFPLDAWAGDYGFSPVTGQVTSDFGWRTDPITGSSRFHGGLDIAAPTGSPVYAPQAGVVIFSGPYRGYGNVVVLSHGQSLYTVYGHNSRLLVQPGDVVYRGQVISQVGSTGRSTGPHLHFEVHYKHQYLNPVAYMMYVQQTQGMLAQATPRSGSSTYGSGSGYGAGGGSANYSMVGVHSANAAPPVPPTTGARRVITQPKRGKNAVQLLNGAEEETIEF